MKTTAKWLYPASLIVLFIILITAGIPDGAVYGSNTDWLSQHVTLAEAIRTACLEQHTLLPDWIGLGGGSNGYQFAYYGFLRPDLLIGRLVRKHPFHDSGMPLPHAPADYVCQLSALPSPGVPLCKKQALEVAPALHADDLSVQLLLCPRCIRRHRMVLVQE